MEEEGPYYVRVYVRTQVDYRQLWLNTQHGIVSEPAKLSLEISQQTSRPHHGEPV